MKSILQSIVLLSSILLLASCDSGVGSGVANIQITPATPAAGITGRTVKGVISGATVTVTDKDGNTLPITSTVSTKTDGSFTVTFSPDSISAGLDQSAPLVVTVDASGATATCDYKNPDPAKVGQDCPNGSGGYAAFGSTYMLEDPLVMKCILATFPAQSNTSAAYRACNVSPASTLAATLAQNAATAAGGSLTADEVNTAGQQVLGLIQTLTGIDMSGQTLSNLQLIDITNLSTSDAAAGPAAFAMAAFNAAVYGQLDSTTTTLAGALANLGSNITSASSGNLVSSGTFMAKVASSIGTAANIVYNQLVAAGGTGSGMDGASSSAQLLQPIYQALGGGTVSFVPPLPAGTTAVSAAQKYVAHLTALIKNIQTDTGAYQGGGFTLPLAKQLNAVRRMTDGDVALVAKAFKYAVVTGERNMTANNTTTIDLGQIALPSWASGVTVTGTLVKNSTLVGLSTPGTASMTDTGTNTMIMLTAQQGSYRIANSEFNMPAVTIDLTNTTNSDLMAEFSGSVDAAFAPESPDLSLTGLFLKGSWCLGSCGNSSEYEIVLNASGLQGLTSAEVHAQQVTGNYNLTLIAATNSQAYSTAEPLTLSFRGGIGLATQNFQIIAGYDTSDGSTLIFGGSVARNGSLDTVTLRDLNGSSVTATMTLDRSKSKANGALTAPAVMTTSDGTQAGTINAAGLVTYADGSVQSLPAAVF